jgi:hypothetical protein
MGKGSAIVNKLCPSHPPGTKPPRAVRVVGCRAYCRACADTIDPPRLRLDDRAVAEIIAAHRAYPLAEVAEAYRVPAAVVRALWAVRAVKTTCFCGAPRRPSGNNCHRCHAEDNKRYRARKREARA